MINFTGAEAGEYRGETPAAFVAGCRRTALSALYAESSGLDGEWPMAAPGDAARSIPSMTGQAYE